MKSLLLRLLFTAIAVMFVARLLPGIEITGVGALIFGAILLSVFNAFLKPIMVFITLPVTILTFGLFIFIINGLILYLTSLFIGGFSIANIWIAVVASILISIISGIINWLAK